MHAVNGCDRDPPPDGELLDIPAGSSFTVEMAHNKAFTSMSYNGSKATEWPDGSKYEPRSAADDGCIGALHTVSHF